MYFYRAVYREPGSADLVYAKLREQFPNLEMHIQDPILEDENQGGFHSSVFQDTEFGEEVTLTMLAPLSTAVSGSSELIDSQDNVGPSPYGAAAAVILPKVEKEKNTSPSRAVIYGSCEDEIKGALVQNLRRYGADSVVLSKTRI